MSPSERIQAILRTHGLNPKTFSEKCGYDRPQVIYDVIKGKTRNISSAMADKIVAAFPDVNRVWLLTGQGNCWYESASDGSDEIKVTTVPLLPLSAIAGPLSAYYEAGVEIDKCQQVVSLSADAEMAIPVTGDSMEPKFAEGSVLFIKRINEEAFIPWGHPLVLDTENGVFIKIVMPDEANQQYIWAESVNPKYPRMHVPKRSVHAMYRVLCATKAFSTL